MECATTIRILGMVITRSLSGQIWLFRWRCTVLVIGFAIGRRSTGGDCVQFITRRRSLRPPRQSLEILEADSTVAQ